jgi:hypothetical protein
MLQYRTNSVNQSHIINFHMHGRQFSEDLCNAIARMLPLLEIPEIEAYTGVSKRQIQRIRTIYSRTGRAYRDNRRNNARMGRRRNLNMENIQVSSFSSQSHW